MKGILPLFFQDERWGAELKRFPVFLGGDGEKKWGGVAKYGSQRCGNVWCVQQSIFLGGGTAVENSIKRKEKRRVGKQCRIPESVFVFFSFFEGRKDSGGGRPLKAQEFKTPRRKKNPRALSFPEKDSSIE